MRELVHEPMNTLSIADVGDRRVRRRGPCTCSARSMPSRRVASRSRSGSGTRSSIDTTISGDVPHVTCGRTSARVEHVRRVERRARVAHQRAPVGDRAVPALALRRERPAAQVVERASSTATMPARAPASIAMLHTVMRRFHRQRADRLAGELDRVAGAAGGADAADDRQHEVLAVTPRPSRPSTRISIEFALRDDQALRGEHVLDLGGADAERERGERAVRARVRVAAHDRHARQRRALLRPDHVDDALAPVEEREVRLRAARLDVGVERLDLRARDRIADALRPVRGRRVVVGGGDDRRARQGLRPARLAGPRTPAGWSPRGRDGGRCTAAPCRRIRRERRGCPRACRTAYVAHGRETPGLRACALPQVDYAPFWPDA